MPWPQYSLHDGVALRLHVALNGVADVAERGPWSDLGDADPHGLLGNPHQAPGQDRRLPDEEHLARVAVISVFDDRDVDIDDVAVLEPLVARYPVTDLVIDRGTDGFGKATIVEGGGDRLLFLHDERMADPVQFVGGDARTHVGLDHLKDLGREPPRDPHTLDLACGLDRYAHAGSGGIHDSIRRLAGKPRELLRCSALCYKTRRESANGSRNLSQSRPCGDHDERKTTVFRFVFLTVRGLPMVAGRVAAMPG